MTRLEPELIPHQKCSTTPKEDCHLKFSPHTDLPGERPLVQRYCLNKGIEENLIEEVNVEKEKDQEKDNIQVFPSSKARKLDFSTKANDIMNRNKDKDTPIPKAKKLDIKTENNANAISITSVEEKKVFNAEILPSLDLQAGDSFIGDTTTLKYVNEEITTKFYIEDENDFIKELENQIDEEENTTDATADYFFSIDEESNENSGNEIHKDSMMDYTENPNVIIHEERNEDSIEECNKDSSEENTEDSSEENTEDSSEESIEDSSEESTEDSSEENTEDSSEESTDNSSEESTEDSCEESTEDSSEESTEDSSEESTEDSSEESKSTTEASTEPCAEYSSKDLEGETTIKSITNSPVNFMENESSTFLFNQETTTTFPNEELIETTNDLMPTKPLEPIKTKTGKERSLTTSSTSSTYSVSVVRPAAIATVSLIPGSAGSK